MGQYREIKNYLTRESSCGTEFPLDLHKNRKKEIMRCSYGYQLQHFQLNIIGFVTKQKFKNPAHHSISCTKILF